MELIQTLWVGDKLSKIEQLSLTSFLKNGHQVDLYCYNEVTNIPSGVNIMDANQIINKQEIFKAHGGSYGAFSDLFRHTLLYKKGGCWVDTDVVCLKPFIFDDANCLCLENSHFISTAVLKLSKGNTISEKIIENFKSPLKFLTGVKEEYINTLKDKYGEHYHKELYNYTRWGELGGPLAITKIYSELNLEWDVLIPETFYPVQAMKWSSIFYDTELASKINWEDCYGIHLWNNMFSNSSNFNKNNNFEKGTIISNLFEMYKIH